MVIEPYFEDVYYFSQGRAPAKQGDHWGYIDAAGEWAVEPDFTRAFPFEGDIAQVQWNGRDGYINLEGLWIWDPRIHQ